MTAPQQQHNQRGDVPRVIFPAVVAAFQGEPGVRQGFVHAGFLVQVESMREGGLDVDVA